MTAETAPLVTAPGENLEGAHRALRQLYRVRQPGWTIEFDPSTDTLYLRAGKHGPAITYFLPEHPQIEFRLDATSAELVGVDFTDFRAVLMKNDRTYRDLLWSLRVAKTFGRVPGLRRVMGLVTRALPSRAGDELEREAARLTPIRPT